MPPPFTVFPPPDYEPTDEERDIAFAAARAAIKSDGLRSRGVRRTYRCARCGHETIVIGHFLSRPLCFRRTARTRKHPHWFCGGILVGENPDGRPAIPPVRPLRPLCPCETSLDCPTCGAPTGEHCHKLNSPAAPTTVPHIARGPRNW